MYKTDTGSLRACGGGLPPAGPFFTWIHPGAKCRVSKYGDKPGFNTESLKDREIFLFLQKI
jgi:hypothetical protein